MSDLQFLQTFYSPYILRYIVKCLQKLEIWWATWTLLKKTYLSDENILLDLIHLVEQTVQDLKVQTNSLLRLVKEVAKLIDKYQIWFLLKMTFQLIFTKGKVICTWIWWKLCAECTAIFRIVKNGILTMLKGCVNLQNNVSLLFVFKLFKFKLVLG